MKNVKRDIAQEYFYGLDNTSTYQQIEEQIGKPNGERISECVCPYYQIKDDLYVVIVFSLDEAGKYDKVGMISLYTKDKYLDTIYPKHNKPTTNFSW